MKKIIFLLFVLSTTATLSQTKGVVKDAKGNPISWVNVVVENTYIGTTTNENGEFSITIPNDKNILVFQYIGYKTKKLSVQNKNEFITIILEDENYILNEVVINPKDNPANEIIRNAIKSKKENTKNTSKFTSDFYSRGIIRLKDVPKKIMGQEIGDFDGALDSTGTGIIYLSETVSKISFQKPEKLKERIIASKVSGNNNGFSYNTAASTALDFYDNIIDFNVSMISPIADNAFNYYNYKFEGSFTNENNIQINKIKVVPKRDKEPVFEGYIYIVEDSWAIQSVDLDILGYRMRQEFLEKLNVKQSFSYNFNQKVWAKNSQSFDFKAKFFKIQFSGRFNYVYSNYDFKESFEKKTFTNEVLSFEEDANKKTNDFWNNYRPIPLTEEESKDYVKKDSIQTLRKSQKYLDSIDAKKNKFKLFDLLTGYTYRNSFKEWSLSYKGLANNISFNTVQGYSLTTGFNYSKRNEEKNLYQYIGTDINYGTSDERLRVTAFYNQRFNNKNWATLNIEGGNKVEQFNPSNPISPLVNTVSTLFFKDNYMKLYEKNFIRSAYQQELINGLFFAGSIEYAERKPVFNTTDYSVISNDDPYTSNNPIDETDNINAGIERHNLIKANVNLRFSFGQKYLNRPDGKFNYRNDNYPYLVLGFEKGFGGSEERYNFDHISGRIYYDFTAANKGEFAINIKGGKFFNAENISFVDFKHFNGNLTRVNDGNRYLNVFNLMPYYTNSTNDSYLETHLEHDFKGFITNSVPLLNKLKSSLILGFHQLNIPNKKPYQEFTIGLDNLGFGKYRFLRLDYVRAYQGGFVTDGVLFGLKFLNFVN